MYFFPFRLSPRLTSSLTGDTLDKRGDNAVEKEEEEEVNEGEWSERRVTDQKRDQKRENTRAEQLDGISIWINLDL